MFSRIQDFLRAGMAAAALLVAPYGVEAVLGQAAVPAVVGAGAQQPVATAAESTGGKMGTADQLTLIQWGAKEGGAFVVILVILFFYRRDWKTAVESWREQHAITVALVVENTKAQTETASALRENTVVVHQAKSVMQRYLPERREGDHG